MPRNIVICCDGTWNTADQHARGVPCPTNVIKTARAVAPMRADGTPQIVFYSQGVGTHWGLDRITGGAFGVGLSRNVQEAYRFIVHNLEVGDNLYVFGFSRGAYTARSLCGLIRKAGVLSKQNSDLVPQAYALYRRRDVHPDDPPAVRFREENSRETTIHFLGVWDTVGALGIPARGLRALTARRHQFHDVELSRIVRNAFHALAIDEHRRAFKPALWSAKSSPGQRVEQVWFAGAHSNVGGGYPESGLADEAFVWLKERAEECGLAFDPAYIARRVHPEVMDTLRDARVGLYRLGRAWYRPLGVTAP
ncbi:MAG TPA: DUF2235 domain-containing protein, partial [Longimicrobiales bacterium]|nr:DUF2235 domain-containing protein [Longimicrobiales bacterium]